MSSEVLRGDRYDLDSLGFFLKDFNVDIGKFGVGYARTLEHLLHELDSGESWLTEVEGKLVRYSMAVGVQVYHTNAEGTFRLKQTLQKFHDGRERKPWSEFSVSEKMFPSELPLSAARRGLLEELGVLTNVNLFSIGSYQYEICPSTSYPGLFSKHHIHGFSCMLPEKEFVPQGYIEHQPDKDNYFEWFKMGSMLQ